MTAIASGWRPTGELQADCIEALLEQALASGYSFLCVPLNVQERVNTSPFSAKELITLQRTLIASSDRCLQAEWFNRVVFYFQKFDEFLLDYAAYLSVCAVVVAVSDIQEAAKFLNWHRVRNEPFQLWIELTSDTAGWLKWNQFKTANVVKSLRVKAAIRMVNGFEGAWIAEPVGAAILSSSIAPLPRELFESDPSVAIIAESEPPFMPNPQWQVKPTAIDVFAGDFRNFLQSPLQPLKDHLPAETYRCFEEDPVKYRLYKEAIIAALGTFDEPVRVLVAGAGRGPLVLAALEAVEATGRQLLDLIVLEKNPFACLGLLRRFQSHSRVQVIMTDMRSYKDDCKFHLIVSELLGSLGDNELAPECLWPLEELLVPGKGVMIPQSYTSFLQPAYSPLLRSSASELDLPYVSYVTKAHYWSTNPQPLLHFSHPSGSKDSSAQTKITFTGLPEHAVVDSLVGYFECVLFEGIGLSTVRGRHTEDMCSWFPAFLPLKEPVSGGGEVTICFKRCREGTRVWYEWCIEGQEWQNPSGHSHTIQINEID